MLRSVCYVAYCQRFQCYGSKNKNEALYNAAAQVFNHQFYFQGLSPRGGGAPQAGSAVAALIDKSFGDFQTFRSEFSNAGASVFGSGWVWAVLNKSSNRMEIVKTVGAGNPLQLNPNAVPLLTMDVWEHAYYLKYQNRRNDYVDTFLDHLVNWDFVDRNLKV